MRCIQNGATFGSLCLQATRPISFQSISDCHFSVPTMPKSFIALTVGSSAVLLMAAASFGQAGGGPGMAPPKREVAPRSVEPATGPEVDLRPRFTPGTVSTLTMKTKSVSRVKAAGDKSTPATPATPAVPSRPTLPGMPPTRPAAPAAQDADAQTSEQEITFTEKVVDWNPETGGTVQLIYDRVKGKISSDALGDHEYDSGAGSNTPGSTPGQPSAPGKLPMPAPMPSLIPDVTPGSAPGAPLGTPGQTKPPAQPRRDPLDQLLEDAVKPDISGVAGTVLTLKLDADGTVKSVTGGERLSKGGLLGPGLSLPSTPESLGGLFGPIKDSAGKAMPMRMRVGQTWTTASNVTTGPTGALKVKTDYKLESARGVEANVSFSGNVESDSQGASPGMPGMPLAKMTGSFYRGNYTWDTREGRLMRMETEMRTEAETVLGSIESDTTIRVERRSRSSR